MTRDPPQQTVYSRPRPVVSPARRLRIGIAGWQVAREHRSGSQRSHLQRYAEVFTGVEINSSFQNDHLPKTYEKWGSITPPWFRFAVKAPKRITHELRLERTTAEIKAFAAAARRLGGKLGPVLIQLPPSLVFNRRTVDRFLSACAAAGLHELVCEPRHASWSGASAHACLACHGVSRVSADPISAAGPVLPDDARALVYYRLHGSPQMYSSSYTDAAMTSLHERISAQLARGCEVWCIFDNTAWQAAWPDALRLASLFGADDCRGAIVQPATALPVAQTDGGKRTRRGGTSFADCPGT